MRITQSMITRNALYRVQQNRTRMSEIQNRIATGKKVMKPSDDPTQFARAERFEAVLAQNDQYLNKIRHANNWINNSVSLLEQLNDIVLEGRDVANRGADGQSDAEIRSTLASKLDSLISETVAIANSQYLGKSVFAGTDTKTANPFIYASGVVSYIGNDQYMTRSYSETISVTINTSGQDLMNTGIFNAMTDLRDNLLADDEAAIRNSIDEMATAQKQLLNVTAEMGARSKNIFLIESRLEQSSLDIQGFLSEARDANLEEEIVRYKTEEFAYQAALQATSNAINLNIMQYI